MAAAAVAVAPLLLKAIPILRPLGKWAILHIEHLFGAGKGADKFNTVYDIISATAANMVQNGILPGPVNSDTVHALIETLVGELKSQGILTPEGATQAIATGNTVIPLVKDAITLVGQFTMQTNKTPTQ